MNTQVKGKCPARNSVCVRVCDDCACASVRVVSEMSMCVLSMCV